MTGKTTRPRDLDCPSCGGNNKDGKVCLFPDGNIFCHSCGVTTIKPENMDSQFANRKFEFVPEFYKDIPETVIKQYLTRGYSTLQEFIYMQFGKKSMSVMDKYYLGNYKSESTAYIYCDIEQRFRYVKTVKYLSNGKRDKSQKFPFYSVYKQADGFKACLFGEHLLNGYSGSVDLVESEKSAIIAAIKYPDRVWLATGGSNGLTYDKAQHLRGRSVRYFVDCDAPGRKVDKMRKTLDYFNANLKVEDIDPSRNDGADIADIILEEMKC
jgi:hypothetical protein